MRAQQAIENLKKLFSEHELDLPCTDSLETLKVAIEALEKQVPKKVVIKPWQGTTCPSCGESLSESLGDGYYKHHTHWDYCHNSKCLQRLDWSE